MQIKMKNSLIVGSHGLKDTGTIWDAPSDLAQQLIQQGSAEPAIARRSREIDGKFKGDDPTTEGHNEAWEDGKAPKTKGKGDSK